MKNQHNRARRHNNNNRSVRSYQTQQIFRYTNFDSTGPLGKLRGTALQLAEKYQAAAKDAQMQGDDVLMQTYQQYADHYFRLQAIAIENEQALKPKAKSTPEETQEAIQVEENSEKETIESLTENTQEAPSDTIDTSVLPPVAVIEE
jgi:hypothetical protein